ncbi:MHYT domain-containing protein [Marivita sp.]|jgi:NO-binding membrane sensor protein with MHYT domain|uniref:MHYT domain-containing protein n=1 Tax=Marivita sp. TaxID=2003365 RepID=UPI00321B5686
MQVLDFSHDPLLVIASLFVAMMAGFTGLSLSRGLSTRSVTYQKVLIVLSAISLGGGIWSMHFVAMLGLQLPILFYYDAVITLASALVAILVVGVALLILHFWKRTPQTLVLAGMIVGVGVLAMHYLGMSAMQLCKAVYTPLGIALAAVASCVLSVGAFAVAYGRRTQRNIVIGTVIFGIAVFSVHFAAIAGTSFVAVETQNEVGPLISNEAMAIGVVLSSFVLCGAFLLSGVTFLAPPKQEETIAEPEDAMPVDTAPKPASKRQIPYQKDGQTRFVDPSAVAVIRAEGHYTYLYTKDESLFCAWSITEAEKRLSTGPFIKTHRSYLINPDHVSGFERMKDNGVCYFETSSVTKVPVSRSRLKLVRDSLGV